MRKVIYSLSVSLDGLVESADGDISWAAPDEELHKHFNDRERAIDIHLYDGNIYSRSPFKCIAPTSGQLFFRSLHVPSYSRSRTHPACP